MAISKVMYGTEALIDLTDDTVTPDDVAEGVTFHGADGVKRAGTRSSAPAAHASTHAADGSDPITPASIGAQEVPKRIEYSLDFFSISLKDNMEYIINKPVQSLTLYFPSGSFDCWLKFETSSSFSGVTLPSNATYLGEKPTFEPGKTYEMSIKDGCVICAEVVSA